MQQVGGKSRFWWRVAEAPPMSDHASHTSTSSFAGRLWRRPSEYQLSQSERRALGIAVTAADRRQVSRTLPVRRSRLGGVGAVLAALLCASAVGVLLLPDPPKTADSKSAGAPSQLVNLASVLGFGIDTVIVTGQRFTSDTDIFDAIDLTNVRTLVELDQGAIRARIERLPWIASARLSFAYPGNLEINVNERTPFARWSRGESDYLIDATGRVLSPVQRTLASDLPKISGEGAADIAPAILKVVGFFPEIRQRMDVAERIGERRWRLHLTNGTIIELPPSGEFDGLRQFTADKSLLKAALSQPMTIDLRARARLVYRPIELPKLASAEADAQTGSRR